MATSSNRLTVTFGANGLLEEQAIELAVLGQQADAQRDCLSRRRDLHPFAEHLDLPAVDRIGAVDRSEDLGPAGAGEARDTEDLAFADGQVDIAKDALAPEAANDERLTTGRALAPGG